MSKPHYIMPTGATPTVIPVRLGAGNAEADRFTVKEEGKLIKLVGESRYDLCAVGDEIHGRIYGVEQATSGGFSIGGRVKDGAMMVTADGLQGTPGTGTIAVGDRVVAGTPVPKGTALTTYPKVCKATSQAAGMHNWIVLSLGPVGTGAVGTAICIERI